MNEDFRKRILNPSLIPFGAFVFIGALVFGFSRLLLAVTKEGSVVLGVLMAACILFAAGALSKGRKLKDSQRLALALFAVLVIVGGVAAGTSLHTREVEGNIPIEAELVAQNVKFDKTEFKLPADEPVAILFRNNDPGIPHNVAIFDTPQLGEVFLQPPLFPGIATRTYDLEEGLPKGVYFFRCDAHPPQMNGRVLVGGATAPAASPTPSPTAPTSPSPSPTAPPTTSPTTVALKANGTAFDQATLTFPASQPITIDFDNQDAGLVHNVSLYTDSTGATPIFQGGFITGPDKTRYEFTAPQAGSYFFRCDVHPTQMTGTATVT